MTTETRNARGEAEYEYEVWQGDVLQAGGSTTDYASAQSEAGHYAMMYAPDGPVEVRIYEKRLLTAPPPAAARGDVRGLVAGLAAYARPTFSEFPACSKLWDEAQAFLAAEGVQGGEAEAKTVPVPTRVHLIGETAVIVGTPGRGWDEEWPDAHNCDAMGCATIGPHVLARVPFTDERALPQQPDAVSAGYCTTNGADVWCNGHIVATARGLTLAPYRAARIAACLNACSGIADPGALVQAARDAVDWIVDYVPDNVGGRDFTLADLRRALGGAAQSADAEAQASDARGVVDLTKVRNNVLAVIPGGNTCDPQQVADDVRAVFAIFEAEARNGR